MKPKAFTKVTKPLILCFFFDIAACPRDGEYPPRNKKKHRRLQIRPTNAEHNKWPTQFESNFPPKHPRTDGLPRHFPKSAHNCRWSRLYYVVISLSLALSLCVFYIINNIFIKLCYNWCCFVIEINSGWEVSMRQMPLNLSPQGIKEIPN